MTCALATERRSKKEQPARIGRLRRATIGKLVVTFLVLASSVAMYNVWVPRASARTVFGMRFFQRAEVPPTNAQSNGSLATILSEEPLVIVEIRPQVELLAAVQSQTTWMQVSGPEGEGDDYFQALRVFIEPYKDHEAIKLCQQLVDKGFINDAPVSFALCLGALPDLELQVEYSQYQVDRAGDGDLLEDFRVALKDLANKSRFADFLEEWRTDYAAWIDEAVEHSDLAGTIRWLCSFFGWQHQEYRIVLAPAMFGGAYGPTLTAADGSETAFAIICEPPSLTGAPRFYGGKGLDAICLHEIGYSFVNPTMARYTHLLSAFAPWYAQVWETMSELPYGTLGIYVNEQLIRAMTTFAARELKGEAAYQEELESQESIGFLLTEFLTDQLSYYSANRDKYPDFKGFVPEMVSRVEQKHNEEKEAYIPPWETGEPAKPEWPAAALWIVCAVVVVIGVILVVRSKTRKSRLNLSSSSWRVLAIVVCVVLCLVLPPGLAATISELGAYGLAGSLVVSMPRRKRWWGILVTLAIAMLISLITLPRDFLATEVSKTPVAAVPDVEAVVVPGGDTLNVHPPGKPGGALTVCFYENGYAVAGAHPTDFSEVGWELCVDCLSPEMVADTPTFVAETPVGIVVSGIKCPEEGRVALPLAAPDEIQVGQNAQIWAVGLDGAEVEVIGFAQRKQGQFLVFRPAVSGLPLGPGYSGTPLVQNGKIIGFITGRLALDFSSRKISFARLAPDVYAGTEEYLK